MKNKNIVFAAITTIICIGCTNIPITNNTVSRSQMFDNGAKYAVLTFKGDPIMQTEYETEARCRAEANQSSVMIAANPELKVACSSISFSKLLKIIGIYTNPVTNEKFKWSFASYKACEYFSTVIKTQKTGEIECKKGLPASKAGDTIYE